MLFLAFLLAFATAQPLVPPPGCVISGNNGDCTVYVRINMDGFGPEATVAFTSPSPSQQGGSFPSQIVGDNVYRLLVKEDVVRLDITFREGPMEYKTFITLDPTDASTYDQTVTDHRATLTINLQGYNPKNRNPGAGEFANGFLPSFDGNNWGVQIMQEDGGTLEIAREYREGGFIDTTCAQTKNLLELTALGDVAQMPLSVPFTVVVLPDTNVRVRVLEGYNEPCPTLPSAYVDCHSAPGGGYDVTSSLQTGDMFDDDCTDANGCNSGLCVAESIIDSACNWDAIPGGPPTPQYGIQGGELVNLTMFIGPQNQQALFGNGLYRTADELPWGTRYNPFILGISYFSVDVTYPSGSPNAAKVRTIATSCASGQQCEFKAISTIAKLDIGENQASVTLFQDDRAVGAAGQLISGEAWFCTLNLPLRGVADYSGIQVTRDRLDCADTDQFCSLGPFYAVVAPHWDCWDDSEGLVVGSSYPSNGIQIEIFLNSPSNRLYPPGGASQDLPWTPVPFSESTPKTFQIPGVPSSSNVVLRLKEGACGTGQGANLEGCSVADFELSYQDNPHTTDVVDPTWTNLNFAGRILSAFELFYLPADNRITVELLTSPAMETFRITEDQGGRPQCYCVLPVVLQSRITENNAACYKSDDVSCVERLRPDQDDDCELCDFLSILRFDLRGLPTMSTNGVLRTSTSEVTPSVFYEQDFLAADAPSFGGIWTPANPATRENVGGVPGFSLQVFQTDSPSLVDRVSFTVVVPSYTTSVKILYNAYKFGGSATGDIDVVGSESGTVLSQGVASMQLAPGAWTSNETPNLVVSAGETLTVTFYATNPGTNSQQTPLVDNIRVEGDTYTVVDVRNLFQIGGTYNNITVLRNCHCDTPQMYWLEITDNVQATKELNTRCCSKDCEAFHDPFTRIMCLDLQDMEIVTNQTCAEGQHPYPAGLRVYDNDVTQETAIPLPVDWFNPTAPVDDWQSTPYDGCGYRILHRVTTSISTVGASEPFRVRARQGGYDGCAVQAECSEYGGCPENGYSSSARRRKRGEIVMPEAKYPANTYWSGNSWYTVLCLPYEVTLNEYSLTKSTSVDCSRGASCRSSDILVAKLLVDTECEGAPDTHEPQVHSGDLMQLHIVANSSWPDEVLEYNPTKGVYPGIGFDVTLLDANGVQYRGKRSKTFHKPNCTFDQWVWSSATCLDCGYRQNIFTVLAVAQQVRVNEVPYSDRPVEYPDRRVLPRKTTDVNCESGTCAPGLGEMFSRLWVQSFRGLPSQENGPANYRYMVLKFGNTVQTPLRVIDESWLWQDPSTNPNPFCVIADPRNEYAINWGLSYASNNAGNFFSDCSSVNPDEIDNCRTPESQSALGAIIVPPLQGSKKQEQQEVEPLVEQAMKRVMEAQQ